MSWQKQLKQVSRSFYLTLRILPSTLREPIGLCYLLARMADTVTDTASIPPKQRLAWLFAFRAHLYGVTDVLLQCPDGYPPMTVMLKALSQLHQIDQTFVRNVVMTLTQGMVFDIQTFHSEHAKCHGQITALQKLNELDQYTYLVAGCVGEFWTNLMVRHVPCIRYRPQNAFQTMLDYSVAFGKGLQMTNILRDCVQDLRQGRCYLPIMLLNRHDLTPHDLLFINKNGKKRVLLFQLIGLAVDHFKKAIAYILMLPRWAVRLRLACLWPMMISLETLYLLIKAPDWLHPEKTIKIRRKKVYQIIALSIPQAVSNTCLRIWSSQRIFAIEKEIQK